MEIIHSFSNPANNIVVLSTNLVNIVTSAFEGIGEDNPVPDQLQQPTVSLNFFFRMNSLNSVHKFSGWKISKV